jgi:hypothetical protein
MNDWQTWAAPAVVALAAAYLLRRALRKRKSCGGDCGCEASKKR